MILHTEIGICLWANTSINSHSGVSSASPGSCMSTKASRVLGAHREEEMVSQQLQRLEIMGS